MSRKHSLPESLELLLDTMCNTFGGIMFIAISLIIISQLVTKMQKNMTQDEINKKVMEQMQHKMEQLEKEIVKEKNNLLEREKDTVPVSAEAKKLIQQITPLMKKNYVHEARLDQLKTNVFTNDLIHRRFSEEAQKRKAEFEETKKIQEEKKEALVKKQKDLEEMIKESEKEIAETKPLNLRFSHETVTTLEPFWIYIKDNKLYSDDDVIPVELGDNYLTLKFKSGLSLGEEPETDIKYLLRDCKSSQNFVKIASDCNSASTLIYLKQYLRKHRYKVSWSINQHFIFIYSSILVNKASE